MSLGAGLIATCSSLCTISNVMLLNSDASLEIEAHEKDNYPSAVCANESNKRYLGM